MLRMLLLLGAVVEVPSQPACPATATRASAMGPFFQRRNVPQSTTVCSDATEGTRLMVSGRVKSTGGRGCDRPFASGVIHVWQANAYGRYDDHANTNTHACRAVQRIAPDGAFQIDTIVPGAYPGRPKHLHVYIEPDNTDEYAPLVTQLYFANDAEGLAQETCRSCRSDDPTLRMTTAYNASSLVWEATFDLWLERTGTGAPTPTPTAATTSTPTAAPSRAPSSLAPTLGPARSRIASLGPTLSPSWWPTPSTTAAPIPSPTATGAAACSTSFDECVAAGYPIMESWPEQCHDRSCGRTFTNTPGPTACSTSFDECVAAGYPIMESSPEQCHDRSCGRTFTNCCDTDASSTDGRGGGDGLSIVAIAVVVVVLAVLVLLVMWVARQSRPMPGAAQPTAAHAAYADPAAFGQTEL